MSPPSSPTSPSARRAHKSPLSIDITSLPPLSQPSPPSNTLIITDLHDLTLFQPPSIDAIKSQIQAIAPLNSFSPLPSFRRIVCSFLTTDDAINVRQALEGEALQGKKVRAKVYFGEFTPMQDSEEVRRGKRLEAPHAEKLFFISPPPSPPHGWMVRNEDPPNKEVHATDLADALDKLGRTDSSNMMVDEPQAPESPASPVDVSMGGTEQRGLAQRSRSSTLVFHPGHHGSSPHLPAVMVEDTTVSDDSDSDMDASPILAQSPKRIMAHTPRPPVELM